MADPTRDELIVIVARALATRSRSWDMPHVAGATAIVDGGIDLGDGLILMVGQLGFAQQRIVSESLPGGEVTVPAYYRQVVATDAEASAGRAADTEVSDGVPQPFAAGTSDAQLDEALRVWREAVDEIERLQRWKAEATEVLKGWDDLADRTLGEVKLGEQKSKAMGSEIERLTAENQELRALNGQILAEIGAARATLGHPIIQACIGMNGIQFPELLEVSDG